MKKILLMAAGLLIAAATVAAQDVAAPKCFMVGDYEVYVLVESSGNGSTGILVDAPEAVLKEYAPDGIFPNATNAVLIRKGGDVWLVDTGYGRNIFSQMAALDVAPEDVGKVLLTHMHGDHIGGLFREGVKSFPYAEVVVSEREYRYWASDVEMNKLPEDRRGNFAAARKVFADYAVTAVKPTDVDMPIGDGITPIAAYGHTPGHVAYVVKDGDNRLLIWGDLTHAMVVQMPHPEISVTYDVDPNMARISRMEALRCVADVEKTPPGEMTAVIGMHIRQILPGVIYYDGEQGYKFVELTPEK